MRYRVVFNILVPGLWFAWLWVLFQVVESHTSMWVMVPPSLVLILFPKEWAAEKISRQPRVRPFERREGNAAEG